VVSLYDQSNICLTKRFACIDSAALSSDSSVDISNESLAKSFPKSPSGVGNLKHLSSRLLAKLNLPRLDKDLFDLFNFISQNLPKVLLPFWEELFPSFEAFISFNHDILLIHLFHLHGNKRKLNDIFNEQLFVHRVLIDLINHLHTSYTKNNFMNLSVDVSYF
jgi:hypothetical protein